MSEAIILRVKRTDAGRVIPFDKIYFFNTVDENVIAQVFPYALVLSITKGFSDMIGNTFGTEVQVKDYPLRRCDEGLKKSNIERLDFLYGAIQQNTTSKYLAVIPTLYRAVKNYSSDGVYPSYLFSKKVTRARKHKYKAEEALFSYRVNLLKKMKSVRSYILIDGEKTRPICLACPKHIQALNGQCFFGGAECYMNIMQTSPSVFVRGVQAYREFLSTEVIDPDIAEAKFEQLF